MVFRLGHWLLRGLVCSLPLLPLSLLGQQGQAAPQPPDSLRDVQQQTIVVTGTLRPSYATLSPVKVDVYGQRYLQRNPESNLMDALLPVNGLTNHVSCSVCGTNNIQINGLEGPYTLVLIDGMPLMGALASVYGLNGIGSDLIERIEVTKGSSSTLYGTEAVAGVVNIITKDAREAPRIGAHYFASSHNEHNLELGLSKQWGRVHALTSVSAFALPTRWDWNRDNFTDVPTATRFSVFNKLQVARPNNKTATFGLRYYHEDRFGGQLQWQPTDRGSDSIYGESILTRRAELTGSYQLPGRENLRIDYSASWHHQNSFYGNAFYKATQQIYFTNIIYTKELGKRHTLLGGGTLRYQTYQDNTPALQGAMEGRFIPGVFAEDEWRLTQRFKLLGGMRLDHHAVHGLIPAPRLSMQYRPTDFTNLRLNLGTGFRIVNVFTEDHAALTGARAVVFAEALQPERSTSAVLSWDQTLPVGRSVLNWSIDGFYTYFTNKIIPDYNADPNLIVYANLREPATSRGLNVNVRHTFTFPLSIELGATYQDVYRLVDGARDAVPFIPNWMGTWTLSYTVPKLKLTFDYVGRVTGPMALPYFDAPWTRPTSSPWFSQHNLQVRKEVSTRLQVYVALKNMFNYTQPSPLIDPAHPFGPAFDTSYQYGPLQPTRVLVGVRLTVQ
jgi:outer membrane receptor for ferrienterochelin and colicins